MKYNLYKPSILYIQINIKLSQLYKTYFIALIHPIQWTFANPVGADRPAKRQKKSSYMSA